MTRRTLVSLASGVIAQGAGQPEIMDTHVHFYDPSRPGGVPWPRASEKVLYRTVLPADYQKLSKASVIVVEASPLLSDNDWILDLATKHRIIRGFVGNLDPALPEFGRNLERYRANRLFRGIRLGVAKAGQHAARLAPLAEAGLTLDLIGDASMYPLADRLAQQYPKLRIVLDHLPLAESDPSIRTLARHKNVYAKVSWILRSPTDTLDKHRAALDEVLRVFGEDRVLYGSNWPVSDLIVPSDRIQATATAFFRDKALEKYLLLNSRRAYQWQ